ncbi:MAG: M23 family metallopeptidase [bacterium]
MRYQRTFQDFQLKSKGFWRKVLTFVKQWSSSSRFSAHVSLVLLAFVVLGFSHYTINAPLTADAASGAQDAWGAVGEDSVVTQSNAIDYRVSDDALMKPNSPYTEESTVRKPVQRTYLVQTGDTFASIAEKFGSTESEIRKANNASSDAVAVVETTLNIPISKGIWYDVKQGDTVDSISQKFKIDPDTIVKNNDIVDPNGMAEGRKIVLPGVVATPTPGSAVATSGSQGSSKPSSSSKPAAQDDSNTAHKVSSGFVWPVNKGSVFLSQNFHSPNRQYPWVHPAWDFASYGGKNVPIFAAAAGRVVHASWSNAGYGNMIMIDHQNGYTTLYGHFCCSYGSAKFNVKNGDWVNQGQMIGLMGTTGASTGVHLHFEICTNYRCQGYSLATRLNPARFFQF